jgi:hypothetical protein
MKSILKIVASLVLSLVASKGKRAEVQISGKF